MDLLPKLLELPTEFFGFVDNFFWICRQFFLDLSTIFLDLSTKISNVPMTLSNDHIIAWVTRPERLKGAKDEVKRPKGPPARSWGPGVPRLLYLTLVTNATFGVGVIFSS